MCVACALSAACQPRHAEHAADDGPETAAVGLQAVGQTAPTLADGANDPAILIDADNPANSLIVGSGGAGGLELYRLDGSRIGVLPDRPISFVDVLYGFPLADDAVSLIVAYDPAMTGIVALRIDAAGNSAEPVSAQPIVAEMDVEGLCTYRSPLSGKFYAFAAGEGVIQQWQLHESGGAVLGRQIRTVPVGLGVAHCVVHDRKATLYYAQETVGIWKLNAEPESDAEARLIDLAAPHGRFAGDVKGVAVVETPAGGGHLLVSDADAGLLQVYDLESDEHVGAFSVSASESIAAVDETEGIAATGGPLPGPFGRGLLVVTDEDNGAANANYKMLSWNDIAMALNLPAGGAPGLGPGSSQAVPTLSASIETEPVESYGDAADDPAIWVHPERPELSTVIGSQKKRGIHVYDLDGRLLQSRADGRINNVDIRYGFSLGGDPVDIVAGSNRTHDSISLYAVNLETRTLVDVADGVIPTGMSDPYGLCMYRSPFSGEFHVFVNDTDGVVKQWLLRDAGNGRIGAGMVREFSVGSQTEGCVADDVTGDLYVGEENVAIWKYSAEPDGGDDRTFVDGVEDGNLSGDIEGMAIYYGPGERGYLLVSDQGIDSFAVYRRDSGNPFLGFFRVVADPSTGIDGVSETDGLDVTGANLGPAFPHGAFVAQDGRNITPLERQNFKIVPWERIAAALNLESNADYNPRARSD